MDSFFSLFDPNEGNSNNNNKKKQKPDVPPDNVKLKGRRRSRRSELRPDSLTEQSSFLCAPELDNELLDRGNSYFDSYFKAPKGDSKQDIDKKPKRRPHRRKSHTPPDKGPPAKGPQTEGPRGQEPLNNRQQPKPRHPSDVGKNVNDLKKDEDLFEYMRKSRRKTEPFSEDQVYRRQPSAEEIEINQVLGQLESISVKEDDYSYSDYCPDDIEVDSCSDDEENFEDSSSEQEDAKIYGYLPPEPRYGNVEYKLQLVSVTEKRFQHLVTQLKWRLASGNGRCTYVVGVTDRGAVTGLSRHKLRASLRTLRRMAACLRLSATVTVRGLPASRAVAEVTARKLPDTQQSVELRIAVLGANDAGKSTLIGVLTQGELDNGRGSARLNMFRHVHEVRSGRTSSLSHELLGFDAQGSVVNYGCSQLMTAERIGERSSKLVSFLDLAGHYKYQRTTVRGLTGYCPHYASLIVSASAGITAITEEHISLLLALEQPFFTVVNKCELLSEEQRNGILRELADLFAVGNKKPLLITNEEMARNCAGPQILNNSVNNNNDIKQLDSNTECHIQSIPVFPISCVTGQGLNALQAYLLALEPTASGSDWRAQQEPCEFQIDEIFHVGDSPGPIVGGLQAMGKLYEGDNVLIGPLETGEFVEISVKTIYRNRVPCDMVKAGQSASLGLSHYPPNLRQGMVLLAIPKNYKNKAHKSPTFGGCTNGKCKNLPLAPDVIASKILNKKKAKKLRRNRNLMQDLVTVESSLKKSVDIEGSNIYKSSDESDGGDKFECRCAEKVYLEDPDDPRGCLYFQAKIHLLRHSSPHISPGFQCTVHVGNVRQTAVIVGIMSLESRLTVGSSGSALLRFSRAEYLRAERRALCRAGLATVAVATILQTFPYRP